MEVLFTCVVVKETASSKDHFSDICNICSYANFLGTLWVSAQCRSRWVLKHVKMLSATRMVFGEMVWLMEG